MTQRILWVDDLRNPWKIMNFGQECVWVKTFHEACNMLKHRNDFTHIYLDNDLGDENAPQGRDVLNHIEEMLFNNQLPDLTKISIHSDNASAVRYMLSAKDSFKQRYNIVMEQKILSRSQYQ